MVVDGATGLPVDPGLREGTFEPAEPAAFSGDLAAAIDRVWLDPALRRRIGENGRKRVEEQFSRAAIAHRTLELSGSLIGHAAPA